MLSPLLSFTCRQLRIGLGNCLEAFNKTTFVLFYFSGPLQASTILAGNLFYQRHLNQYLKPAVGSYPNFLLCYRASTHGWLASTFHNRCDGKRDSVSIIKVGHYVFGGYTDISWGKKIAFYYICFYFSLTDLKVCLLRQSCFSSHILNQKINKVINS